MSEWSGRALVGRAHVNLPGSLLARGRVPLVSVQPGEGKVQVVWRDEKDGSEVAALRCQPVGRAVQDLGPGADWLRASDSVSGTHTPLQGFLVDWSVRKEEAAAEVVTLVPPGVLPEGIPGMEHGIEIEVPLVHAPMAEVRVELAPSGNWYGGGHLMTQHWPLERASWEVGPYMPFDNGPNGVNTLLHAAWMASGGLACLADPETPFLHVGMNAPQPVGRQLTLQAVEDTLRGWKVGVQNAFQECLPHAAGSDGDGFLRLQTRASYLTAVMDHPLLHWKPWTHGTVTANHENAHEVIDECQPDAPLRLRVALGAYADVREASMAVLRTLPAPDTVPDEGMLRRPVWTTWARYHTKVDQAKVLAYADEICDRKLERSVMEIDDRWQTHYGEAEFDPAKFPDPKAMCDKLHSLGFAVTVWVTPFFEVGSAAYEEGEALGYFVRPGQRPANFDPSAQAKRLERSDALKQGPAIQAVQAVVKGFAALLGKSQMASDRLRDGFVQTWLARPVKVLDVTNPAAVAWFVGRLQGLQARYGIDGFKFDAGEPCFLPPAFRTHLPITQPAEYTKMWVERVAARFPLGEVRTGHLTQRVGHLVRMGDKFSSWGLRNGLQSLVPTLLTSGILGYPYVLPDMVGGNAYFGVRPTKELMVRWAQANALMPSIQFSIPPWDMWWQPSAPVGARGRDADQLVEDVLAIRSGYADEVVELARKARDPSDRRPICRPMWWLAPRDPATWTIADQFALGDDTIVAPVVVKGASTRDVYLPQGTWRQTGGLRQADHRAAQTADLHVGPTWVRAVDANITTLLIFTRVNPSHQ